MIKSVLLDALSHHAQTHTEAMVDYDFSVMDLNRGFAMRAHDQTT